MIAIVAAAAAGAGHGAEPLPRPTGTITPATLVSDAQYQWLTEKARLTMGAARAQMDDAAATWIYSPGGYGKRCWPRDCYYIVHGAPQFVPPDEIRAIVRLLLHWQRPDGMVPKHFSGGGGDFVCWGPPPEADSAQFAVLLADEYSQRSGDTRFVAETLPALKRAMDSMPRNEQGLSWIDPAHPHTAYGFTDQVAKTGTELFSSLLYWEAARQLAAMATAVGEKEIAQEMLARARLIEKNLATLWDDKAGMYLAASQDCRQIDIWGSAYAVYIGFPDPGKNDRICRYLVENYPKIVYAGQVRHLPGGEYWQKTSQPIPQDTYQNGAYWGTASGWVAYAIARVDPALASNMLGDMIDYYRRYDAFECVNAKGQQKIAGYGASVANPLAAIRRMRDLTCSAGPVARLAPAAKAELCQKLAAISLPQCSVQFHCADPALNQLMTKAEGLAAANIVQFAPTLPALIEGGGYSSVYTETQPMGGEMYAKRNPRVALNNQLLFMLCQRADGRLPGRVISLAHGKAGDWKNDPVYQYSSGEWESLGLLADYGQLQGNALPYPAFKMYYLAGKPAGYLKLLAESLEDFDAYLWRTRDPDGEGVLQSWCVWDTGEDNCHRFGGSPNRWPHDYPPAGAHTPKQSDPGDRECYYQWCTARELSEKIQVPLRSMDMMAYSYENRMTRALISEELGDGQAGLWRGRAEDVRRALQQHLWRPEKGAAYDKDRNNQWLETLVHNNLRCMYYGVFSQQMADEFIRRHLLNPQEFLTPVPLPSIAANDPLFCNIADNNWSGQPQGLTWQRAIRALENYGRYAELTMFGRTYLKVLKTAGVLTQQFDPFDAANPAKDNKGRDGYGPTVLGFMEYVSRMFGVYLERDHVYWSGLADGGAAEYTQHFGDRAFALRNDGRSFTASLNGAPLFTCSDGVRVHTDLHGRPLEIIGIDTVPHAITFRAGSTRHAIDVQPNQIWSLANGQAVLIENSRTSLVDCKNDK